MVAFGTVAGMVVAVDMVVVVEIVAVLVNWAIQL
jgi:hypothetical protein